MTITCQPFGTTREGHPVERYTLVSGALSAEIMTYGGTLLALHAPDRAGVPGDVLLGFETLEPYLGPHPFIGSLIGRYANRIAGGRFTLGGVAYTLECNDGPNHLHGGSQGFHRRLWQAQPSEDAAGPALALRYRSGDGESGYPGALDVAVTYTLEPGQLRIEYRATTDRDTVLNLTNHAYFNLAGSGDVRQHVLTLPAPRFVPIDHTSIPLGELCAVDGTPMDFRSATPIGARLDDDDQQLIHGQGYDHTWVLDKPTGELGHAAQLYDPASGRLLDVYTTEPGVQFYSGNQLDGSLVGKRGQRYTKHSGLCLETQHLPDSPNQPQFPPTTLRPGETYRQTTLLRFSTRD